MVAPPIFLAHSLMPSFRPLRDVVMTELSCPPGHAPTGPRQSGSRLPPQPTLLNVGMNRYPCPGTVAMNRGWR